MPDPRDRSLQPNDAGPAPGEPPSKTRRKKDMKALQDLGAELVALEASRLAALELPERLAEAIAQARTITKHEARRRQLQFVGRLMRTVDPEPIRAALQRGRALSREERLRFAAAERWRDRLLEDERAADAFVDAYPGADRSALAVLAREARAERASGRPPHKARALFRFVDHWMGP